MSVLTNIKKLLGGVDASIEGVKNAKNALEAEITKLDEEKARLLSAPAPLADVARAIEALITSTGEKWRLAHGPRIVAMIGGRLEQTYDDAHPWKTVPAELPPELFDEQRSISFGCLCALAPDLVVGGLRAVIDRTAWDEGPPIAARVDRLRAIAIERADLVRQHADLVDRANASGLGLSHYPDTMFARHQAAERARRLQADASLNRRSGVRDGGDQS